MSEETTTEGKSGIAQLREQFEAQARELAELKAEKRISDVASALRDKGLDAKRASSVAKFYSGEDASEAAVGKWLEENADAFGGSVQSPPAQVPAPQQPVSDPNVAAAQAVQQAAFGSATPTNPPAGTPIVIGDPAELQRLYEGGASIEQLQAMNLFPKNLSPTRGALDDWK